MVLVVLAGYLALGQLFHQAPFPSVSPLIVLLLLAITCGPLQIRMPRLAIGDRAMPESELPGVGVWLLFVFAALLVLPARYAAIVSMAAVVSEALFAPPARAKLVHTLFRISASNLSLLLALDAYQRCQSVDTLGRSGAVMVSALVYFLIYSSSQAAAVLLANNRPFLRGWLREYLPTAPLYGVLAGGGALVAWFFEPSYLHSLVLLFPVISLLYYCYDYYFGRLRAERQHAREMASVHQRTVEALALAVDAKDRTTGGHLWRVQRWALRVGQRLGCTNDEMRALEFGALLHDIGKIAVPEHLLLKPAKLTRQEFSQIAIHPQVGAEILAAVRFPFPVAELVHCHHENWDGSGYPRGLKGEESPRTARILSVVDCLDALISDRPYRSALNLEKAAEIIESRRGSTFDPAVVKMVLEMLPELAKDIHKVSEAPVEQLMLQSPRSIDAVQTSLNVEERSRATLMPATPPDPPSQFLHKLYETVRTGLNTEEVLRAVLTEIGSIIPHDGCAVFLAEGNGLSTRVQNWPSAGARPLQVGLWEGPTGWVAARAETLVNANPAAEAGDLGLAARCEQWRDALIVPLWSAGRAVGTLNLYSKTPETFTSHQARNLELMTANLGITLQRAALSDSESSEPLVQLTTAAASPVR